MADTLASSLDPLILDLIEWCVREPRTYAEVLDAWRTSCPRLTVWEDANERGFLMRQSVDTPPGDPQSRPALTYITVTPAGHAFLAAHGRATLS